MIIRWFSKGYKVITLSHCVYLLCKSIDPYDLYISVNTFSIYASTSVQHLCLLHLNNMNMIITIFIMIITILYITFSYYQFQLFQAILVIHTEKYMRSISMANVRHYG